MFFSIVVPHFPALDSGGVPPNYSHLWVSNNGQYSGKMFPYRNGLGDTEVKRSHRMLKLVVFKKNVEKAVQAGGTGIEAIVLLIQRQPQPPKGELLPPQVSLNFYLWI